MQKSEKRPALLIDRDGTINRDCPYCHDPKDLHIYKKAVELIKYYSKKGYLVIVVTNQSGINRGYFSEREVEVFNAELKKKVEAMGGKIDDFFFCPHRPDENCDCRKPRTGMLKKIISKYDIDLTRSIVVGDRDDIDGEFARNAGLSFKIIFNKDDESSNH
ncbi:MAG: HAD family hydrolase [Thermoplasmatales archaeon]|nr:HAD family hydrolase [Thermoplasmatales archaeon]MCW6169836.1 HAD family hydrolase [Thermoplasmatales archaeon]